MEKLTTSLTWERAILLTGVRAIPCKWVYGFMEGSKASNAIE